MLLLCTVPSLPPLSSVRTFLVLPELTQEVGVWEETNGMCTFGGRREMWEEESKVWEREGECGRGNMRERKRFEGGGGAGGGISSRYS